LGRDKEYPNTLFLMTDEHVGIIYMTPKPGSDPRGRGNEPCPPPRRLAHR